MTIVSRNLGAPLIAAARHYPVVTVTGPRQSGKTTLCQAVFPQLPYVSLEPLDSRQFARLDPRGFLAAHRIGAVIDEIQNAPDLLSYLQEEVDARPEPGRFVLTGSQHLGLSAAVAQSLAGRTSVLYLLPLSLDEVCRFPNPPQTLFDTLWWGGFPRIHDRQIPPALWLGDYVTTYLERDVRQVLRITDLVAFDTFLRLAAGRVAQEVNLSTMGADAGVSHNTARGWLSVLEATFVCVRFPPWHTSVRKRLVKATKLHFVDSGLVCHLLGIQEPGQLLQHPLRGAVFETWVAGEALKWRLHRALAPSLYHYRQVRGAEVDLVLDTAERIVLTECKSGATVSSSWFAPLLRFRERLVADGERRPIELRLVHGGDAAGERQGVSLVPWWELRGLDW